MIYPGDTYNFILSLATLDGDSHTVNTPPTMQIINAASGSSVLGSPAAMPLISGSNLIYRYTWNIPSNQTAGDYIAVASYVLDSTVITGRLINTFRVGDSYVTGPVALDATVSKDSTVAKDATVAHIADLTGLNPNNSSVVLAIKAKTDNLPADPVSTTVITALAQLVTDIHDCNLGAIIIDRTQNPRVMVVKRVADGSTLRTFSLSETSTTTSRT